MAGRRDVNTISGVNISGVNEWGYYWTSTTPGTLANPTTKAIAIRFYQNENSIRDISERDKYKGYSVRLVQNVTSTQK
jgi:transposase-like protein